MDEVPIPSRAPGYSFRTVNDRIASVRMMVKVERRGRRLIVLAGQPVALHPHS